MLIVALGGCQLSWTVFATDPVPAPDRVKIDIAIQTFGDGEPNPSTTIIDNINACP